MIEVKDLWKSFGSFTALRGISFRVERGAIAGFLGPNGAGKSTSMRILTSYLTPGAGEVSVAGFDVRKQSAQVCASVGYLPEQMAIYPEMRVSEYLRYRGVIRGLRGKQLRARVEHVLEVCSILDVRRALLSAISRGYRQRVGLADALLHEPPVLILDEPSAGLDPLQVIEVRKLIDRLRGNCTVLLSSHILGEVEQVCDQVIILHRGQIQACESRSGWQRRLQSSGRIRLVLKTPAATAEGKLRMLPGVTDLRADGNVYTLRAGRDVRLEVYQLAVAERWELLELRGIETTLEELFVEVTTHDRQTRP